MNLVSLATALSGEINGGQVLAPGPKHSPGDRSLSVRLDASAPDGFVVHSFAGDDPIACKDYVRQRLGLPQWKPGNGNSRHTVTHDYRDPKTGETRYRKERIEFVDGKKTFIIKPKGRGGSEPLLYGGECIADLAEGQPLFVVEGEKKVDRLRELGAIAVSADSGAESKWLPSHAELLRGLTIILWPDSDEPGEKYIARAAICLNGHAASIRIVRPFGKPNGGKGLDVCDWKGGPDELAKLAETAGPYAPLAKAKTALSSSDAATPSGGVIAEFTEDSLALRFADKHADKLRYVAAWGKWLAWTGTHWEVEKTLAVYDLARKICREAARQCNNQTQARALSKAKIVAAVEMLARSDRRIAATIEQWDADPWLLNTPGGVIDLRTGQRRPNQPGDYMTKITAVAPGGSCPLFLEFLAKVTNESPDAVGGLIDYLQRVLGYALTGDTREHALFFLYGTGANGKSVLVSSISGILGSYHKTAPIETFTVTGVPSHPTDLAGLKGARLITAVETEEGRRWAEAKLKSLTGGDAISARFMRQDFFDFTPCFKLVIAGNHKPGLRSVDEAIRRRFHLVPFTITIPPEDRDKGLANKLKAERSGILQWMIDGCLKWQREGLNPPAAVLDATAEYLAAEDSTAAWIAERCALDTNGWETSAALFASWKAWAELNGEFVGNRKQFAEKLECRGLRPRTLNKKGGRGFQGIRLNDTGRPWAER
jgi:putative DNA primase/helicase